MRDLGDGWMDIAWKRRFEQTGLDWSRHNTKVEGNEMDGTMSCVDAWMGGSCLLDGWMDG